MRSYTKNQLRISFFFYRSYINAVAETISSRRKAFIKTYDIVLNVKRSEFIMRNALSKKISGALK